ncbi:NAD-dependent epimerase/dehydratase family protein [Halosegnis longus]|uniref:NAD-dependent epimerase/dehydratase family protein n=1 Tax=Halosegnis longus TaxID=2216012 RepID=A0AAJ4R9I1_9EURY|nr:MULTISPECIES: NAD-dependent epimerase/dehydratase family protein [Halobacteriales]RNJ27013.1 NAD-dependent epimerase/dehydratase family protein [Salella cibi]
MTATALVIGGTRFIGRHTVSELLDNGYDVTVFNRGNHENPFADHPDVAHVEGDRTEEGELRLAGERVAPDIVIDCVAYYPRDVRVATDIFADVDAYVYISSGASYGAKRIPKREDETRLRDCTTEQATDDSDATYGPRKAEGDRAIFAAAEDGVNAMAVRPPVVYGPHDYTERFDYWIDRVDTHDEVVVPGDGTNLWHLVYVEDVASALRIVAEEGEAGEAYNVGDGHAPVLGEWVDRIADACDTEVETVFAGPRELAAADLELTDFPLYIEYPHLLETAKIRELGWEPTPLAETVAATVEAHRDSDRTGRDNGPDREAEERVLSVLETF